MLQSTTTDAVFGRITSSPFSIVAAGIVLLCILVFGYKVIVAVTKETGRVMGGFFSIMRTIVRELAGSDATPYERINGVLVVGLLMLVAAFLFLFATQSVRSVFAGDAPPWTLLAALIFCIFVTGAAGVLCVRVCAHHRRDIELAKRTRSPK
jgi:hypothetical protein